MNFLKKHILHFIILLLIVCSLAVWLIECIDTLIKFCATVASLSGASLAFQTALHLRKTSMTETKTNVNSDTNNEIKNQNNLGIIVQGDLHIGGDVSLCNDINKISPIDSFYRENDRK